MDITWEAPFWNDKIAIALGYPRDGWLKMVWMTPVYNQLVSFDCSDVFQPFEDMVIWLEKIAANRLPATFYIDEEGEIKGITAARSHLEVDAIEIAITADFGAQQVFRCRTSRVDFIHEFIKRFEAWLDDDYDLFGFGYRGKENYEDGYGFDLRSIDLSALKKAVGYTRHTDADGR